MYEYEDSQLEDIYALRSIIELLINDGYLWGNAIPEIWNTTNKVKISLILTELPTFGKMVDFVFEDGRRTGTIYPLKEIKDCLFWSRLEMLGYIIKPKKGLREYVYEVNNKSIGEVAKYIRQNVLVRNVKLFQ